MDDFGPAKVRISVKDAFDADTTFEFTYRVMENHAPALSEPAGDRLVCPPLNPLAIHLSPCFTDEDGDSLKYTASVSPSALAEARVNGEYLTLIPLQFGNAVVTVTASDPMNAKVRASFNLVIRGRQTDFDFYPNPVSDFLYLRTGPDEEEISVRILSVSGAVLYESAARCSVFKPLSIDMRDFVPGRYALSVKVGDVTYNEYVVKL